MTIRPEYIIIFETADGSPSKLSKESREGLIRHFRAELEGKKVQPSTVSVGGNERVKIERINPLTPSQMVEEFHETFGHPVNQEPTNISWEMERLRHSLIAEELLELEEAMDLPQHTAEQIRARHVAIADALGDLEYVVHGAALAWGYDLDAVTAEIHDSNMSKLGEDGKPIYRDDGKVMKGPDFTAPDLGRVLYGEMAESDPED